MVALVASGLGISFNATKAVVGTLSGEVTLAFVPFARKFKEWIAVARRWTRGVNKLTDGSTWLSKE
tara:strand:- start:168 stop:365 length:198 start_codon:yes stop_codon:yes gene_type:complete